MTLFHLSWKSIISIDYRPGIKKPFFKNGTSELIIDKGFKRFLNLGAAGCYVFVTFDLKLSGGLVAVRGDYRENAR